MSTKYTTRSIKVTKFRPLKYHIYISDYCFFFYFVYFFFQINLSWRRITMRTSLSSTKSRNVHKLISQKKTGQASVLANLLFCLQKHRWEDKQNFQRLDSLSASLVDDRPFVFCARSLARSLARVTLPKIPVNGLRLRAVHIFWSLAREGITTSY